MSGVPELTEESRGLPFLSSYGPSLLLNFASPARRDSFTCKSVFKWWLFQFYFLYIRNMNWKSKYTFCLVSDVVLLSLGSKDWNPPYKDPRGARGEKRKTTAWSRL